SWSARLEDTRRAARARAGAGRDARHRRHVGAERLEQAESCAGEKARRQLAAADVAVGHVVAVDAEGLAAKLLARPVRERELQPAVGAGADAAHEERRVLDGDVDPVDGILDDIAPALRIDVEPARESLGEPGVGHRLPVVPDAALAIDADRALARESGGQRR